MFKTTVNKSIFCNQHRSSVTSGTDEPSKGYGAKDLEHKV